MYTLGIDIGASSVKVVALAPDTETRQIPLFRERRVHAGVPLAALSGILDDLDIELPLEECGSWAVCGQGAQALEMLVQNPITMQTVPSCVEGARSMHPDAKSIIGIGAQSALFVSGVEKGGVPQFAMNESCAAGTGSFFEDQMERLGLSIEDYSKIVEGAQSIPRLSGRCSVFAKTDIIHCQQEGVPTPDILQGLCYAMVKSYRATIVRSMKVETPVMLAGGILRNAGVVKAIRDIFGLAPGDLLVDDGNLHIQALGAALHARTIGENRSCNLVALRQQLDAAPARPILPRNSALPKTELDRGIGYRIKSRPWTRDASERVPCALGIDVGSTSTNLVLVDDDGDVLDAQYLRTGGDAKEAITKGLESLKDRLGDLVNVTAVGVTGSGRARIGRFVGADVVQDEITAQSRAAVAVNPLVDTVFEIGGQDSKYIQIRNGNVVDFQMNKICAAGTGSFLEEQAARLDIGLGEYGALALSAKQPIDLGERCTVFVQTAINKALAAGAAKGDVAAGLCQSIVRNYLHRVVASKPVGEHIVLAGGVAYNPAIVSAFEQAYGDRISVSPHFAVSGALGAALLAREAQANDIATGKIPAGKTTFKGWDLLDSATIRSSETDDFIEANRSFFRQSKEFYLEGYSDHIDPSRKTVGVPRALMLYKFFPLANAYFRHLGYNVVISSVSDEDVVRAGNAVARGEMCFPVKLLHGHVAQLLERGIDYLFMPRVHTILHGKNMAAHNYGCAYMQSSSKLLEAEFDFAALGVGVISPVLDLELGKEAMATAMLDVGVGLGHDPHEVAKALLAGSFAVSEFNRKVEEAGTRLLADVGADERVLVMVTRNYGIDDEVLNCKIPDLLIDRGVRVITMSHLAGGHDQDITSDYPDICWPFGQHILSCVKMIRRDPRMFAVYLTNHGCGPDSMLAHLVAEEMGDKPYLQIEVDEHFSQVGVITRIEAFLNSIGHATYAPIDDVSLCTRNLRLEGDELFDGREVAMPSFGLIGRFASQWLRTQGYDVRELQATRDAIARGQSECMAKEYVTFAASLGAALTYVEAGNAANEEPPQILLPTTEGAEADNQYSRVLRSILDKLGHDDVRICSPKIEQIWRAVGVRNLVWSLLAADVCYAAPSKERDRIAEQLLRSLAETESMRDSVLKAAADVRIDWEAASLPRTSIAIVGEWPCVFDDGLTGGIWQRIEAEGYRLVRMPVTEYLSMLWEDASDGSDGANKAICAARHAMALVADALGAASPFAEDYDALRKTADEGVGAISAGGTRYRYAKTLSPGDVQGVLAVASMYENTDIILGILDEAVERPVPICHMAFDAALGEANDEKLMSFLYYLE